MTHRLVLWVFLCLGSLSIVGVKCRLPCVKGDFPDRENVSVADKRVPAFGESCHEVTEGL